MFVSLKLHKTCETINLSVEFISSQSSIMGTK